MKHVNLHHELGDFTTDWRVIPISALAIVIGLVAPEWPGCCSG